MTDNTDQKQKKRSPKDIEIIVPEGSQREDDAALAKTYLRPTILAAATIKGQYKENDSVNINALVDELSQQVDKVKGGNMSRMEAMLVTQAHSLDALFADLAARSRSNMRHYPDAMYKYMTLALKAQSQCRTTIEALAEIKNPRPYIQNNRAQYQQVNNGHPEPRAHEENPKQANELLEDKRDEAQWLDTGAPETASRAYTELEAMGTQHRAAE
jgi:hypothetical protein